MEAVEEEGEEGQQLSHLFVAAPQAARVQRTRIHVCFNSTYLFLKCSKLGFQLQYTLLISFALF